MLGRPMKASMMSNMVTLLMLDMWVRPLSEVPTSGLNQLYVRSLNSWSHGMGVYDQCP